MKVLKESVYTSSRMNLVDNNMDELIELIEPFDSKQYFDRKKDPYVYEQVERIILSTNKLLSDEFDANIKVYLDPAEGPEGVKRIAYTPISKSEVKDIFNFATTIEEKEDGEGLKFKDNREIEVYIEIASITLFKYFEDYFGNIKKVAKLTGRHISSLLLHEIGHHLFLSLSKQLKDGRNGKKEVVLSSKGNELDNIIVAEEGKKFNRTKTVLNVAMYTIFNFKPPIFLGSYRKEEKSADRLAIMYGYSKEVVDVNYYMHVMATINTKSKINRLPIKFQYGGSHNQYMNKYIIEILNAELKNPINSPKDKIAIKKTLNYISSFNGNDSDVSKRNKFVNKYLNGLIDDDE